MDRSKISGMATPEAPSATDATTAPFSATAWARQAAGWAFTTAFIPGIVVACTVLGPKRRTVGGPRLVRMWGHTMARIAGIEVQFTARAQQVLAQRLPRVLTFNHSSTLDVLTGAALLPEGGVLVVKEEMRKIPLLGIGCASLGSVFLERGNREHAYESLKHAAARMHAEQLQLLIAPEGTRATDGKLGRFKLGAFHLAALAQVPIQPMVLHNHFELWPHGQFVPKPGVAIIDALEPLWIAADEDPRAVAEGLRERYAMALANGPQHGT